MITSTRRALIAKAAAAAVAAAGALRFAPALALAPRRIIDMAQREVSIPTPVRRVATLGAVPVINSFLFALRAGEMIVNGLPSNFAHSPRWKYQRVFAPGLDARPEVQGAGGDAILDSLLQATPDVVLTMSQGTIHALESVRLPVVYLAWDRPDEVKDVMSLLGQVLDRPEAARDYARYFDAMLERVGRLTAPLLERDRPRVLYCDLVQMTQPHLIAEWWIRAAGGRSVTDDGRSTQSISFSLEQLIAWDPQVIILSDARQVPGAYADPRLREIAAIRSRRVHVAPCGAHLWTNRTVEEPLTVLWATSVIQPQLASGIDVAGEAIAFYGRFFGTELRRNQVEEIIRGAAAG